VENLISYIIIVTMHREYPNEFTFCIGSAYCGSDLLAYYLECAFMSVYASNFWLAHNDPTSVHNLFLISVARNPWDKMISYFYWHKTDNDSFEQFCLDNTKQYDCWFRYADNKIKVDKLMKYEDLHNEIKNSPLPYNNELLTIFKKKGPVKKVKHTYKTIEVIKNSFKNVIDYFKYDYNT